MFRLLPILGLITILVACEKSSVECPGDFTGSLATEEEKLAGNWTLTAIESTEEVDVTDDSEENPSTDIFAQYDACQRDGVYAFGTDRSYLFQQGFQADGCSRSSSNGTWKLSGNSLSLSVACSLQEFILTFNSDASQFSFSQEFQIREANGNIVQTTVTFVYSKG